MAKLTDVRHWLQRVYAGDQGRSNSLIQVARRAGIFQTGGRGKNAPEMEPRDFAAALVVAGFQGESTRVHEGVERFLAAPLVEVQIYPGDRGGFRSKQPSEFLHDPKERDSYGNLCWPPLVQRRPAALADCLENIAYQVIKGRNFSGLDNITFEVLGNKITAIIELFGERYPYTHHRDDENPQAKDYGFRLIFSARQSPPSEASAPFDWVRDIREIRPPALDAWTHLMRKGA